MITRSSQLKKQLTRIRLLLCDVDGVLTNGTIVVGHQTEYKVFSIQDGLGIHLLRQAGIKVGWLSHRPSPATQQRADELKIDFLHQQPGSKVAAAQLILNQEKLAWSQLCYIGDDLVDLGLIKRAGLAVAVANAIREIKKSAHLVTQAHGGHGAVREVIQLILVAQKKWPSLVQHYSD